MKKNISYIVLLLLLASCAKKSAVVSQTGSTDSKTATGIQTPVVSTGSTEKTATGTTAMSTGSVDASATKNGDNVEVHYTGKLQDGSVFDSSYPRKKPLAFKVGAGQMIPGFDKAVVGMKIGDKKTVTLAPAEAYGDYDPKAIIEVKRSQFKELEAKGFQIKPGVEVPTQFGPLLIKDIKNDVVTVDVNHKLAGKTLIFDIEMMKIGGDIQAPEPVPAN